MYSAIHCLYNLSSVDLSAEAFPPKSKQDSVGVIGERSIARDNALPRFVSSTCGAVGAAIPKGLVRLAQAHKPFRTLQMTARSFALLGASGRVGDHCVSSQLRLDSTSSFRVLRTRSSSFCTTCPEILNLSANTRPAQARVRVKQALACSHSLAQLFDFAEAFARLSVSSCLLSKPRDASEFVAPVRRLLNCRTSVECGVCNHEFARRSILAGYAPTPRAMLVYALAELYLIISGNARRRNVFVLNKFRTLRKLVWLLSIPDVYLAN
ncbi:5,10-methylenetetrahydrofolate reductase [Candidatus Hodgkinia cicadicola]|nr:5,10-methylenetetrahydrofolate reductase [Candidatus Hodgkinia cicadicola]